MSMPKGEIVELKPDIERVLATIAYVIDAAAKLGSRFTQYEVVKSIFVGDRDHLNEYGRLISSDWYVAMIHGPVPSTSYNVLKCDFLTMRRFGLSSLPWKSAPGKEQGHIEFYDADISHVEDILSPSDMAALDRAVAAIGGSNFKRVRKLTHEDPAYIDAWEDRPDIKRFPMSLGLLFDTPNFERARELSEISKLG